MNRTQTIFVDLQRLLSTGPEASFIIRLMMAYNGIALANQCLSKFKEDQSLMRRHVQKGSLIYFVRLQYGHSKEAMDLIQKVHEDQNLCERVNGAHPGLRSVSID